MLRKKETDNTIFYPVNVFSSSPVFSPSNFNVSFVSPCAVSISVFILLNNIVCGYQ